MLDHLTQPHPSRVRTDGDPNLVGHEVDGEDVVEAAGKAGRVDLAVLRGGNKAYFRTTLYC